MKLHFAVALVAFSTAGAVSAAFIPFTNRSAFDTVVQQEFSWDFEEFSPASQPTNVLGRDGTTSLVFANANPFPSALFPTITTLGGMGIYFNPQLIHAFEFSTPITAFGISMMWGGIYNPSGVSVSAFDDTDQVIGQTTIIPADALTGPFLGGDFYEGFLGFQSSTPIYSLRFSQLDGSVWYDNALWAHSVPEPSVLWLLAGGLGSIGFLRRHVQKEPN